MSVKIHGKDYKTVAERVIEVHEDWKDAQLSIETEIVRFENREIIIKATITTKQGVFVGHAHEKEDSSNINKTSFVENCETSAIGRAAASAGYLGTEFCSANELENALHQQKTLKAPIPEEITDDYVPMKNGKNAGKRIADLDKNTLTWIIEKGTFAKVPSRVTRVTQPPPPRGVVRKQVRRRG